MNNWFKICAT